MIGLMDGIIKLDTIEINKLLKKKEIKLDLKNMEIFLKFIFS
jgi:hypothetical protein